MKSLLPFVANPLVLIAFWAAVIWLLFRSPRFAWFAKLFMLIGWGLLTVGAMLYVVFAIYIPQRQYFAAIATVVASGVMCFFWFVVGLPEIAKMLRSATKVGLRPWWE